MGETAGAFWSFEYDRFLRFNTPGVATEEEEEEEEEDEEGEEGEEGEEYKEGDEEGPKEEAWEKDKEEAEEGAEEEEEKGAEKGEEPFERAAARFVGTGRGRPAEEEFEKRYEVGVLGGTDGGGAEEPTVCDLGFGGGLGGSSSIFIQTLEIGSFRILKVGLFF